MLQQQLRELEKEIFETGGSAFDELCMRIFRLQYEHNPLYHDFCRSLKISPGDVTQTEEIPFLPISFFKSHSVKTTDFTAERIFESSGTTGSVPSRHFVKDLFLYRKSFENCFQKYYGHPSNICILALLPSYLERGHSSLVYMADELIRQSQYEQSGFYLDEHEQLLNTILKNESAGIPTLLLGVTYALLDFSEKFAHPLHHTMIMETGGMKGRRKEMLREEVHAALKERFQLKNIHSEYGMTELLSQAYSEADGIFKSPGWMQVWIRNEENPFDVQRIANNDQPLRGAVNIIDLANLYSCAFLATDDYGKLYADGRFEITGRMDGSDLRGCSLMYDNNL